MRPSMAAEIPIGQRHGLHALKLYDLGRARGARAFRFGLHDLSGTESEVSVEPLVLKVSALMAVPLDFGDAVP